MNLKWPLTVCKSANYHLQRKLPDSLTETVYVKEPYGVKIFTPIMGFNSMIGFLLVVREREID